MAGLVRLIHPFPSLLDAVATVGLALLAGAGASVAILLGMAMFALQASIGTLNDIVDAERDRGSKLAKPIPLGLVPLRVARSIAAGSLVVGLVLSAAARPLLVIVAGLGIGLGYAYDLRLKTGPWSWLPFALGIGLLPVFAWLGATGRLPAVFGVVLPAAILAGAGLALANQLADAERDRQAGLQTTVARLGRASAWRLSAVLELIAATLALGSLAHAGAGIEWLGAAVVSIGLASIGLALGRNARATVRERAWELQAIGLVCLGLAWLAGLVGRGLVRT